MNNPVRNLTTNPVQKQTHTVRCYLGRDENENPQYGRVTVEVEVDFRALAQGHAYQARKNKAKRATAAGRAVKITYRATEIEEAAACA